MEPHPEKPGYIAKTGLWLILTVASVTMIGETKLMLVSQAVSQGKYWLLLSCHLVHSNLWHWLTNWSVFALLLSWMELKKDWGFFPFAGLLIGFSLYLALDSSYLYAGFSGILSGLLPLVLWRNRHRLMDRRPVFLGLGVLALKGLWDLTQFPSPSWTDGDSILIPQAHFFGALAGVLWPILVRARRE